VGSGVGAGLGIGLGLGVVGALSGRGLRPLAKAAIKGGVIVCDRATAAAGEAIEVGQDLYYEARDERAAEVAARERLPEGNGVVKMRSS
jgi:hypothetical protein